MKVLVIVFMSLAFVGCKEQAFSITKTMPAVASAPTTPAVQQPSQIAATPTPAPTATPAPSATPSVACQVSTTSENLRILFMVDNSGSTSTTDPSHNLRVKTIQSFLNNYGSHTNLTYSFGYFSSSALNYDLSRSRFSTSALSSSFGDAAGLSSALTSYNAIAPLGSTGYTAAFNLLKASIAADEAAGTKENYIVVFMSDGMPTDITGNIDSGIISLVDQLKATAAGNGSLLTVSSVYFGPSSDNVSIGHLMNMASEGQGQFVDTNQLTSSLVINDIINVPGQNCH